MMKPSTLVPMALLAVLLAACSAQKPQNAIKIAKPQPPIDTVTSLPPSTKMHGQWTVEDVLDDFGDATSRKLKPYFAEANVAYPPREILLLALKEEKKLELWAKADDGGYRFIRDYDIQAASGKAGPKLRQGDKQVPEGVYRIVALNPNSHYHLSMKLNYPNAFDLRHANEEGRDNPGSDIFIHGKAASIGCLAMGDETIEELFVLTAQTGKENVKVVIAPRDPRLSPLESSDLDGKPEWVSDLYAEIAREVSPLSAPSSVSHVFRQAQQLVRNASSSDSKQR